LLGWLVACIAPPPMTAPPQAQAQSLARAIRTDIIVFPPQQTLPAGKRFGEPPKPTASRPVSPETQMS
jgi:hypothetical protein